MSGSEPSRNDVPIANESSSDEIMFGGKKYALTFSDDFDFFDTDK